MMICYAKDDYERVQKKKKSYKKKISFFCSLLMLLFFVHHFKEKEIQSWYGANDGRSISHLN